MKLSIPLVTINMVVCNGQKYIRPCLGSVKNQTYQNIEVNVFDNDSKDQTKTIVKTEFPEFNLIENSKNFGMWGGQEEALKFSNGKYIMALSVDVILEPEAIEEAVKIFEKDERVGTVEPKIYRFELKEGKIYKTDILDTCGLQMFKSRRIVNVGHGETDIGKYNKENEIFAAEGAAPIFRKTALKDCEILGEITDHDMFWYSDDIDLTWRMRLFGWKQVFSPKVIAYHDRQTTHALRKSLGNFIEMRKKIPKLKRRLDYRNSRLMLIKNDHTRNLIKDLPHFLKREIPLWGYFLIFEPFMLLEIPTMIKLLPRMFKKRSEIMRRAKLNAGEIHKWFI